MMTARDFILWFGGVMLALAALALWRVVVVVRRRARAGQPQRWVGLVFRGLLIAGLVALGASSLLHLPPPELVNHNAPAAGDAIVVYAQSTRDGNTQTLVGVSARDGATRWTRSFNNEVAKVTRATPDVLLALVHGDGVYALRPSDGATLWRINLSFFIQPGLLTNDASRLYVIEAASATSNPTGQPALTVHAYSMATGAPLWQAELRVDLNDARVCVASDGLLLVAGVAGESSDPNAPWGVEALDAATGAQRWFSHGTVIPRAQSEIFTLLVTHGVVVVAPRIGPVTALRESDGAIAWASEAGLSDANPPQLYSIAADDQRVYVVAQASKWATDAHGNPISPPYTLLALDAGSGTIQWSEKAPPASTAWSGLAVSDDVLLTGSSILPTTAWAGYNPTGVSFTAYDAATGRFLWQDNTPRVGVTWDFTPVATPLAANGAVYLLGIESDPYIQDIFTCVIFCPGVSWLYAVNPHTGAPWWRVRMGYAQLAHLVF
jgi:outer membrane protein assembly factor BamB